MNYFALFISALIVALIEERILEGKLKVRSKIFKLCKKEYIYFTVVVIFLVIFSYIIELISEHILLRSLLLGIPYGTMVFFVKIYKVKE